ncbi:sister chromatid cohesion protein DCC1 isoform X1 [Halyomorpha halys]|uniref:sister chromatid cohesion protein DCC1 isoform X1 n=1 Tax=Halyomorpha halys TaxID=286706 RepID=UPI0006D50BC0|nr:sister chromatid cohesion protein DCC1 isoform X1 [Halyomorpha halys]
MVDNRVYSRSYERTINDVCQVIHHAKLEEKDLRPLTQVLYFSEEFPEYKILELDKELFKCLKESDKLVLRGQKTDKAVLCTKNKTFDIKEAETSNSLLLIPNLKFAEDVPAESGDRDIEEKEIVGVYHEYFELKQIRPRLLPLRNFLKMKPYKGIELEEEDQSGEGYFDTEKLLEFVQASEEELVDALRDIQAFSVNGKWRILDNDYHFRVLGQFLALVESNSWGLDQIPFGESLSELSALFPDYVLHHIFQIYLEPTGEYTDNDDELFKLVEFKICRFLGTYLLRTVEKFNLNDFLRTWRDSVPEGMITSLDQLGGLAVMTPDSRPPAIWLLDEEDLPEDFQERFTILFSAKERWTYDEIHPYIKRLSTEKQSVNSILTKYSRTSNVNGVRYHSARHGK